MPKSSRSDPPRTERLGLWQLVVLATSWGCAATPSPSVPPDVERRAQHYAAAANDLFSRGERKLAFELATRALVVRLAACGVACPEPAASFLQIGDLRLENGQPDWAAQAYSRGLEILAPFRATHGAWSRALEVRRTNACEQVTHPSSACP